MLLVKIFGPKEISLYLRSGLLRRIIIHNHFSHRTDNKYIKITPIPIPVWHDTLIKNHVKSNIIYTLQYKNNNEYPQNNRNWKIINPSYQRFIKTVQLSDIYIYA